MRLLITLFLVLSTQLLSAQTDLTALHAPPTQAEIDAVKAEWATRDHGVYNWTVLHTGTINQVFTVEIVSHEVNGDVHYAAVRYPENYDPMGSYPVLISNHGGANGFSANGLGAFQSTCYRSFFVAMPSFRSEELRTGGITSPPDLTYTSGGVQSEMNGDTDDALALLTGVLQIAGADANRVGVLGGSRGGGVSHLMACKDDRIKRASIFFGATDHMTLPGLQAKMENYVDNGGGLNPPETATYTYGVAPYLAGTLTLAEARLELLRRSAIYFIDELPLPYEVHHGDLDPVVTPNHSQLFAAEFANMGITSPDFEYYEYAGELHSLPPATTNAAEVREAYLCELNNIILPVELVEFNGTCEEKLQRISLEWTALIGQSANTFVLQWSTNGRDWKAIKTLTIAASANELAHYIYDDNYFYKGNNYYRLKEIDVDGSINYHRVIEMECGTNAVSIFPNPTTGLINLKYELETGDYPEQMLVFDANGKAVFEKVLTNEASMEINLGYLPKGVYSCHVLIGGSWVVERVILN